MAGRTGRGPRARRVAAPRRRARRREREPGLRVLLILARLACVGALVTVALSVAAGVRQRLALVSLKTQTAFRSYLEERFTARALVVRDERVYLSADYGRFQPLVRDGDRVAALAPVARVVPDDGEGEAKPYCPAEPGVVSFTMDGLETVAVPERLPQVIQDLQSLVSSRRRPVVRDAGELVKPGDALFRVVDNFRLWLVVEVPESFVPYRPMRPGARVRVRLVADGRQQGKRGSAGVTGVTGATGATGVIEVEGSVESWDGGAVGRTRAGGVAVVSLKQEVADLLAARTVDVEVVTRAFWGVVVPRSAVVSSEDGRSVVYLASGPGIVKHEARVLGSFGGRVALEDVPEGAQIVLNPPGPRGVLPNSDRTTSRRADRNRGETRCADRAVQSKTTYWR